MDTPLYLLDTNILVHFVRRDAVWNSVSERYRLLLIDPAPIITIVTSAELRSLAFQNGWGKPKIDQMEFGLGYFDEIFIDNRAIVDAYASIDAYFSRQGRPMGKNDLWIAATTHALGARLLTTDRDFDPLSPMFLERDWIDASVK